MTARKSDSRRIGDEEIIDMDVVKKEDIAKVGRPLKVGNEKREKRAICGKARDCKIVGGKVSDVYDEVSKQYLPIKEFQKLYNEKGERILEDKKLGEQIVPVNMDSTSNINLSTSGTSGIDISVPDAPEINVDIETKKDKEKIEDVDPYDWYLKRVLRRV